MEVHCGGSLYQSIIISHVASSARQSVSTLRTSQAHYFLKIHLQTHVVRSLLPLALAQF